MKWLIGMVVLLIGWNTAWARPPARMSLSGFQIGQYQPFEIDVDFKLGRILSNFGERDADLSLLGQDSIGFRVYPVRLWWDKEPEGWRWAVGQLDLGVYLNGLLVKGAKEATAGGSTEQGASDPLAPILVFVGGGLAGFLEMGYFCVNYGKDPNPNDEIEADYDTGLMLTFSAKNFAAWIGSWMGEGSTSTKL